MSVSAKGKQPKQVRQLQCQEQCIEHIPYYLSGLSREHFFRQPFSKQLYAIGTRWLNDRLLSFLGPFKFCFISALDAIFNSKIYQILVGARKFLMMSPYSRNFPLSLRFWWKVPLRCGSQLTRNRERTLKPLSSSVFEALKTVEILRRFRGQRGGQLRSSSRFSTSSFSSKFKVLANVVDLRKTSSVSSNIQNHIYDAIIETIPNAVLPYPSTSSSGTVDV